MTFHAKQKSFTLVEILLVVTIVGLLAGLVLNNFQRSREQSQAAATKSNLEMIRTAIEMFKSQYGGSPAADLSNLYDGSLPDGKKFLPSMPKELISHSNFVTNTFDGNGGWFWDSMNEKIVPNISGADINGQLYESY